MTTTNDLNSVLIEGRITKNAAVIDTEGTFRFTISSVSYTKQGDDLLKKVSFFSVEGTTNYIEDSKLLKGKRVRIIGGILEKNSQVIIIADHIEFKPPHFSKASK